MNVGMAGPGWLGGSLVAVGALAAVAALAWTTTAQSRRHGLHTPSVAVVSPEAISRPWLWLLFAVLAAGLIVRLVGLDSRGMFHSEVWIPGLDLPPGVSSPPPRHGFLETAVWHFRFEPHPFGYYLAMLAWTKVAGTSLWALRLPAALFGAGSVFLTYRLGASTHGHRVGVAAAALLSVHAFHVYWSQAARMYAPGAFIGLLATWLLLQISRRDRPSPLLEVGYVASIVACAMTVEFTWPLLLFQILWTALNNRGEVGRAPREAYAQALAWCLSAPMLSHAIVGARGGSADPPSIRFLAEYFNFGLLFDHARYRAPPFELPFAVFAPILLFSVILFAAGLWARPTPSIVDRSESQVAAPSFWPMLMATCAALVMMIGFVLISFTRKKALMIVSVTPFLGLLIPPAIAWLRPGLRRVAPGVDGLLDRHPSLTGLIPILAIGPTALLFVASFEVKLLAARAFALFVPYVLIVIAAGIVAISRRRVVATALAVALAGVFATALYANSRMPISWRDFRGLSQSVKARLQPGDVIFTRAKVSSYTPFYYYLGYDRVVAANYASEIAIVAPPRVWVLAFPVSGVPAPMARALTGYRMTLRLRAWETEALLYVRLPAGQPAPPPSPVQVINLPYANQQPAAHLTGSDE